MNSFLQYPSLDEKILLHYFNLSNISSQYKFESREPDTIVPLNWHMNLARNSRPEHSISNKCMHKMPLSVIANDDTPECISESEVMATLGDIAFYQLQCTLLNIDEDILSADDYYEEDYNDEA